MTEPLITTAGPFPKSFVGIHFDNFLKQVGVQTAPHFLHKSPPEYVTPGVFEMQKLALFIGSITGQQLAGKAKKLFGALSQMQAGALFGGGTTDIVMATIAHEAALYSYLAAGVDHEMYELYARIHEIYYLSRSTTNEEARDYAYRAAWGRAHYAQRFQDRKGEWKEPWKSLELVLSKAGFYANKVNLVSERDALTDYWHIASVGPPAEPLNLEEVLKTLNPGEADEAFRGIFMTELKRFLDAKEKEFPPEQQLTFAPFEMADHGRRILMTTLRIRDADGDPNSYPVTIKVSHLSGVDEEKASQVGTTVVSICDDKR